MRDFYDEEDLGVWMQWRCGMREREKERMCLCVE